MIATTDHDRLAPAVAGARSFLFVPGDRPTWIAKAAASHPDVIVVDLEDAVAESDKVTARSHLAGAVEQAGDSALLVRVNGAGTRWYDDDVAAVRTVGAGLMLPKSADRATVETLGGHTELPALVLLVETATGVRRCGELAALPGVTRLALGHLDLAAELGVDPRRSPTLDHARAELVLASTAAGLPGPVDGVTAELGDDRQLRDDLSRAVSFGMDAKLLIQPGQVALCHEALAPTPEQVRWARRVLATGSGGAARVDGAMVDAPVRARARRIVDRCDFPTETDNTHERNLA